MSCADCSPPHNCEPCSMELTIKDLKKENAELKAGLVSGDLNFCSGEGIKMFHKLKAEVEKLKEEKIIAVSACEANIEIIDKWEADDENLTKVMSMVSKELGDDEEPWVAVDDIYDIVKKLKKENEKLNFQVDALDKQATDFCLQKGKLKEEVKTLKEENETITEQNQDYIAANHKLEKELKEWEGDSVVMNKAGVMLYEETKKEVEKLKEIAKKNYQQQIVRTLMTKAPWDEVEEIDKLKEENDKLLLKETKTHNENVSLKSENEEFKKVVKSNQSIREEYEKEMREIKIAMGCDGPLSWDIKDILKWIDRAKCYTGGPSQADADYEKLVDNSNNDNLVFGDIIHENEMEIKRLTKTLQLAEDKIKDFKESEVWEEFKRSC